MRLLLVVTIGSLAVAARPVQPASPRLVMIHPVVTSTTGERAPLLTRDDFEVRSEDVERPVEAFVARNRPTIALLLDVSASVFTFPGVLEEAVECVADGVDERDRLRIGAVARHLFLGPVRSDRTLLRKDLATALHPSPENIVGPSPLWDAVAVVAAELKKGPEPRAIVLVTDGRSTGNRLSLAQAASNALENGVAVNIVFVGPPPNASIVAQDGGKAVIVRPFAPLASLAHNTGGALLLGSPARPAESLSALFMQLRDTYTLGFQADGDDGKLHRLDVRIKRDGVKVYAPAWYVVGRTRG
jgi:hypothetical protein